MSVRYQCDKGHTLNGLGNGANQFSLKCEHTGSFSGRPANKPCKAVTAGQLPAIPNAVLTEYNGRRVNGRVVAYYPAGFKYECRPGYSLTGSSGGARKFMARVTSVGALKPALPQRCKKIKYTIQGQVKDARNGRGLRGTKVTIVGTGRSTIASNGFFTFSNVPKGTIKLRYERGGYIVAEQRISVSSNINNGGGADVNMSPRMANSQWRATIKWDATPRDLDTYVKWGWTKTYYGRRYRRASGLTAKLEKDDTNGYGPETVYLTGVGKCRGNSYKCDMKYMINDYTRRGRMPNYRAEVTLYTGDRVAGTWKLRDCGNAIDRSKNWWHVFTIDARTNRLKWHCGMGGRAQWLLHSSGGNVTDGTSAVDFESYVGPFPGRFFQHSQRKHAQTSDILGEPRVAVPAPKVMVPKQKEEIFRFGQSKPTKSAADVLRESVNRAMLPHHSKFLA